MSLIVQKFGGSSLSSAGKVLHVAHIIQRTRAAGHRVIAVLSAQGDTTDVLLDRAHELAAQPDPRELDMLLAAGEQMSVALCAIALRRLDVPAVSLCAWQVPICSDGTHTDARIERIGHERVKAELDAQRVVLVAGFQAVDEAGDLTTLGRGGSDTSAVALAEAFHAELCQIYTDVDGIYTTDPRICPQARRIDCLPYAQMHLLASRGAQVLHARSVALAQRAGVTVEVRSCEPDSRGSRVTAQAPAADVVGVTKRAGAQTGLAEITAVGGALPSAAHERLAIAALERAGIAVRAVEAGADHFALLVDIGRADEALCLVHGALFPER